MTKAPAFLAYDRASLIPITIVYGTPHSLSNENTKLVRLAPTVVNRAHSLLQDPAKHCQLLNLALNQETHRARRLASSRRYGNRLSPETRARVKEYMAQEGSSARRAAELYDISHTLALKLRREALAA